jgi:hypothetical protein
MTLIRYGTAGDLVWRGWGYKVHEVQIWPDATANLYEQTHTGKPYPEVAV